MDIYGTLMLVTLHYFCLRMILKPAIRKRRHRREIRVIHPESADLGTSQNK